MTPAETAIADFILSGLGDFDSLLAAAVAENRAAGGPLAAVGHEPVPVQVFKETDLGPLPALPSDRIFRTSGTTGQVRGVRRVRNTALYDLAAVAHARRVVPALPRQILSLCPSEPDSSLGHMLGLLGRVEQAFSEGAVHPDSWQRLTAMASRGPVLLAATAFALDALLAMEGAAPLNDDSVVMVTGGFKGRNVRLDAPSLYQALGERLGSARVVGEYGMTELSSQLWTQPVPCGAVPSAFLAPRWLRVRAADPISGEPVESGAGVLRFWDLANAGGVLAIETQDLGLVVPTPSGDRVHLVGRLQGAEARGCSLRAEATLRKVPGP